MYESFTDQAQRVVVLAQEEARMLNHNYVGAEHILLGLIHDREGVAGKVLKSRRISLKAARQQIAQIVGQDHEPPPPGHIPFTAQAKNVLDLARQDATDLGCNYVGTEHILLALIRGGEGVVVRVLTVLGVDLERLRHRLVRSLHPTGSGTANSELRDRVIAPCSVNDQATGEFLRGDPGVLLLRMLLFEQNIIDSTFLREFPALVDSFGVDQVVLLLKEGRVRIKCDPRTVGENGESPTFPGRARSFPLPFGTYCFNLGWNLDPRSFYRQALDNLLSQLKLPKKTGSKLESALAEQFAVLPLDFGQAAMTQLEQDLEDDRRELFRTSLAHVLEVERKIDVAAASKVWIEIDPVGDGAYKTTTNLDAYGIKKADQHGIVRSALFGIGGLYFRLEEMRDLRAISGFQLGELPIFDAKVDFLARQITPEAQAERFNRVISLAGLPNPSEALQAGETIDIERFLKVRSSTECQEFRAWLRTLDHATDAEIEHHVKSLRARAADAIQSKTGRAIRFGTVTGAGLVPGIGLPLGVGLGALDSFVIDRLMGEPGPAAFLSRHYKSIFIGSS